MYAEVMAADRQMHVQLLSDASLQWDIQNRCFALPFEPILTADVMEALVANTEMVHHLQVEMGENGEEHLTLQIGGKKAIIGSDDELAKAMDFFLLDIKNILGQWFELLGQQKLRLHRCLDKVPDVRRFVEDPIAHVHNLLNAPIGDVELKQVIAKSTVVLEVKLKKTLRQIFDVLLTYNESDMVEFVRAFYEGVHLERPLQQ